MSRLHVTDDVETDLFEVWVCYGHAVVWLTPKVDTHNAYTVIWGPLICKGIVELREMWLEVQLLNTDLKHLLMGI